MSTLNGKTIIITGASRGIGKAMAIKFARDGANIVIASKTDKPHPKLAGTIHETADEVKRAGGNALALQVDVRFEEEIQSMVKATLHEFGGVDILINNAGAVSLTSIEITPAKKFDLLQSINLRAPYLTSQLCLPYLKKSDNPHILNISPPIDISPKWFRGHTPYTVSKYAMTMCTVGMSAEFLDQGIAVNSLWPKTIIATAALKFIAGTDEILKLSRKPEIVSDAAYEIVTTTNQAITGQCLIDEDLLKQRGIDDFEHYAYSPEHVDQLQNDLYIE